jgi:NADPH:quinone reductase-like Zn-dependent oxidoreductase
MRAIQIREFGGPEVLKLVDLPRPAPADGGAPVDAVFEMAGGETFEQSLAALAPFGRLVTYGIASRQPNTVRSGALMRTSRVRGRRGRRSSSPSGAPRGSCCSIR